MNDNVIDGTTEQVRGSKAHINIANALRRLEANTGARSVALFEHGSLQIKLYAPRGHDPQTPHTRDEIYVVAQGSGVFFAGDERRAFQVGDCLFAPAGSVHRFEAFTDDFAVWVMFYGPEGGEAAHTIA
ncbi:MAG TPA: cupin domain-containing protein [Blastocatellia bacterium]|nr:cupin domain-containing protein [Blastocatellia bacterium]